MTDHEAQLARACGYFYFYPGQSYLWRDGEVTDFDLQETEGRTAVLAVGSNRAPMRLNQKYLNKTELPIPVQHAFIDFRKIANAQPGICTSRIDWRSAITN